MDDKKVIGEQEQIKALVEHEGWPVARKRFTERILDLQNAFNLDVKDPQALYNDLQARKLASVILFDFLRDIEGTAQQVKDSAPKEKSYLFKAE